MRYFIVTYTATAGGGTQVSGSANFTSTGGNYLNRGLVGDEIIRMCADQNIIAWNVVVTNILELTEADYNVWTKNV